LNLEPKTHPPSSTSRTNSLNRFITRLFAK
jgi:hypothetical protein